MSITVHALARHTSIIALHIAKFQPVNKFACDLYLRDGAIPTTLLNAKLDVIAES